MTTVDPDDQGKTTRIPRVEQREVRPGEEQPAAPSTPSEAGASAAAPESTAAPRDDETDRLEPTAAEQNPGSSAQSPGSVSQNPAPAAPGLVEQRDADVVRPAAPLQQEVVFVPLAVNVGDGFKFGCGFFLASVLAMLVGFVLLAALFVLASVFGLNVPITR